MMLTYRLLPLSSVISTPEQTAQKSIHSCPMENLIEVFKVFHVLIDKINVCLPYILSLSLHCVKTSK